MEDLTQQSLKPKKRQRPKSKGRKIFDIISTIVEVIVFLIVVAAVVVVVLQKRSGKDVKVMGYSFFYVATDSMAPTINPKEVIMSREVKDINTLKVGDVITFIAPSGALAGNNITHRIVGFNTDDAGNIIGIYTKGDNPNVEQDNWTLMPKNVKAKYVRTMHVFTFMLSGFAGYFVCIILPLLIIFGLFFTGIIMDKLRENKEEEIELSEEQKKQLANEYYQKLTGEQLPGDADAEQENLEEEMFSLDEAQRAAANQREQQEIDKEKLEEEARVQQRIQELLKQGPQASNKEDVVEEVVKVIEPFRLKPVEVSYDTSKLPSSAPTLEEMIDYSDFEESDIGGFQETY